MSSRHYTTSSTSSRSSSTSSSGDQSRVLAPKNISRLGRNPSYASSSKTVLEAPIDIPESGFKVPTLPESSRHRPFDLNRAPLKMHNGHTANYDTTMSSTESASSSSSTPTPNRLKRLSLLAKSPVLGTDYTSRSVAPSPLADENNPAVFESVPRSVRRSVDDGGTPRRTGTGIRSSISYSPAAQTPRQYTPSYSATVDGGNRRSMETVGGRELQRLFKEEEEAEEEVKGETLTEKHAELLRAIAQKERRVNELKQELQAEQAALTTLRSKWTSLISNFYPTSPTSTPMQSSSSRLSSADSFQSHTTTRSANSQPPEGDTEQPGFQALLNDVLGSAPLVDPDLLEGGRRFIGDLMRTVGAAAGGNVPDKDKETRQGSEVKQASGGIDLSTLKGMFAWSSTPQSTTVRIRPSDSSSSIKDRRSPLAVDPSDITARPASTDTTAALIDI